MFRSKIPFVAGILLILAVSIFGYRLYAEAAAFSELKELEDKRIGVAAVIYFLISAVFKLVIRFFTRHVDPKNRTPEQILKGIKTV